MATMSERRQQLQEQYYFNCACDACSDTDRERRMTSLEGSDEGELDKVKDCLDVIERMQKDQGEPGEMLGECEACLAQVKLPAYNVHLTRLRSKAFDLAIEAQEWDTALDHGTRNLESYRELNPPFTPAVGYLYANLGKLLMYRGKLDEAVTHLHKAEENFSVSLGSDHYLYGEVRCMLEQCQAEIAYNESTTS
ncbi:hypothetical protein EGW08_010351 [Elysia chlorotica]|uniref:Tetratricopeptide repeat protein n=1 Tax=Elysia chlorotica TaxID=188477 RepID=A0A433TK17_ELYCH|nr:hypothetical protein EGW08_010351 [Elysia chlorotica]